MEGYTDKVISPLSHFSPLKQEEDQLPSSTAAAIVGGAKDSTQSLKKERDRRFKMAESYDILLSMVPNLYPKVIFFLDDCFISTLQAVCFTSIVLATRENIVSETIAYIQSLEKEITNLENQLNNSSYGESKGNQNMNYHRYPDSNSSIDVTVSRNNVAFFGIQSPVRPRLLTDIFMVFHDHKTEVLAANVAVNQMELRLTVTAAVINGNVDAIIESIKRDLLIL
ncbi:RING finger and CHY zinc finger domain-containing protein 1 isoform 1 [Hibiscus syriacus]|uniref:RING finger and CHY zinc finger domain-containing protein 1 isoform 1 n=1 Tax=Hibiscus syriacus TaxID=106335 RepID=A0A6A2WLX8_HIBSY|nr:RING finger and CHY zinc finger domain-containing protein 1 isoform 1 [Hibiscus syriacus]